MRDTRLQTQIARLVRDVWLARHRDAMAMTNWVSKVLIVLPQVALIVVRLRLQGVHVAYTSLGTAQGTSVRRSET